MRAEEASAAGDERAHRRRVPRHSASADDRYDGHVRSIVQRPALLLGLGVIVAVVAFQLWITPSQPAGLPPRRGCAVAQCLHAVDSGFATRTVLACRCSSGRSTTTRAPSTRMCSPVSSSSPVPISRSRAGSPRRSFSRQCCCWACSRYRLTASSFVATVVVVLAGLTPWLFELGRMAIEATTQPLLVVLLLLWLERTVRLGALRRRARLSSPGLSSGSSPTRTREAASSARCSPSHWWSSPAEGAGSSSAPPGRRFWSRSCRSVSTRCVILATSPPATRRRRSHGTACPAPRVVAAGDRELVDGHRPVALGHGRRSRAVHPQRRLRGAVRCRRPPWDRRHRAGSSSGNATTCGGATFSWRRSSSRFRPRSPSTGTTRFGSRRSPSSCSSSAIPALAALDLGCQDVMAGARRCRRPRGLTVAVAVRGSFSTSTEAVARLGSCCSMRVSSRSSRSRSRSGEPIYLDVDDRGAQARPAGGRATADVPAGSNRDPGPTAVSRLRARLSSCVSRSATYECEDVASWEEYRGWRGEPWGRDADCALTVPARGSVSCSAVCCVSALDLSVTTRRRSSGTRRPSRTTRIRSRRRGATSTARRFPLYFSSFLDYKSPVFVYGLAGVFRLTGPDREVGARLRRDVHPRCRPAPRLACLSTDAQRVRRELQPSCSRARSPWLFELGRVAFEVAMEPLFLCLALLGSVERASRLGSLESCHGGAGVARARRDHLRVRGRKTPGPAPRGFARRRARAASGGSGSSRPGSASR